MKKTLLVPAEQPNFKNGVIQERVSRVKVELAPADYRLTRGDTEMFTGRAGRSHRVSVRFTLEPSDPQKPEFFRLVVDDHRKETGRGKGDWPHTTYQSKKEFKLPIAQDIEGNDLWKLKANETFIKFDYDQDLDTSVIGSAGYVHSNAANALGGLHGFFDLDTNLFIASAQACIDKMGPHDNTVQALKAELEIRYSVFIQTLQEG